MQTCLHQSSSCRGAGAVLSSKRRVVRAAAVVRPPSLRSSSSAAPAALSTRTQEAEAVQQQDQQQHGGGWGLGRLFGARATPTQQPAAETPALRTITEAELWQMLEAEQEVPLVVMFSATWCGPCKIMGERLERLVQRLGPQGMQAVKIDTDACELASQLKVHKLPTLFFVGTHPGDNPPAQFTGLLPEAVMLDLVQNRSQFLGTDLRRAVSC